MPQSTDSISPSLLTSDTLIYLPWRSWIATQPFCCHSLWSRSDWIWWLFHLHHRTCYDLDMRMKLRTNQDLSHKLKQIKDRDYHLLWSGSLYLMKFQILHIFVWMMAYHNHNLSDWKLGHLEEPIHSEFHPFRREYFSRWSGCGTQEATLSVLEHYQKTSQEIPQPEVAHHTSWAIAAAS